jgi:hypothetical protein
MHELSLGGSRPPARRHRPPHGHRVGADQRAGVCVCGETVSICARSCPDRGLVWFCFAPPQAVLHPDQDRVAGQGLLRAGGHRQRRPLGKLHPLRRVPHQGRPRGTVSSSSSVPLPASELFARGVFIHDSSESHTSVPPVFFVADKADAV